MLAYRLDQRITAPAFQRFRTHSDLTHHYLQHSALQPKQPCYRPALNNPPLTVIFFPTRLPTYYQTRLRETRIAALEKLPLSLGLLLGGFLAIAASVLLNRHHPGMVSTELLRFMLIFGAAIMLAGLGTRIGIWLGE